MKRSANLHMRKRHEITACLIQKSQYRSAMRMLCSCHLVARLIALMKDTLCAHTHEDTSDPIVTGIAALCLHQTRGRRPSYKALSVYPHEHVIPVASTSPNICSFKRAAMGGL